MYMAICKHTHIYINLHIYIYIHICIYIYIYVYTYVYIQGRVKEIRAHLLLEKSGPPCLSPLPMPENRGGGRPIRDLSQEANKINLKRTLTIQKIFDFLGAPCKPIGPLYINSLFFLYPFFSPFFF